MRLAVTVASPDELRNEIVELVRKRAGQHFDMYRMSYRKTDKDLNRILAETLDNLADELLTMDIAVQP